MKKTTKTTKKRGISTKKYLDDMFEQHSKILVVRVDCGYKKPYSDEITLDEMNKDITNVLNNRRTKPSVFEHNIGYIIKKEYTQDKGVHNHAIFMFDGQKVQNDEFKAQQIGEYWNQITCSKGSYYNCNKEKKKYINDGIGLINHKDENKRKILEKGVVSYLLKDEQSIDPIKEDKKSRSFVRGTIPSKKSKKGKPRE